MEERDIKNNGWRHDPKSAGATRKRGGGATSGQGARDRGRTQQQQRVESAKVPVQAKHPPQQQTTTATLLVPFSVGSALQREVQEVEDDFVAMTGCQRVRVVEQGGDKLVNLLGRQDPWASKRVCPDPECPACLSRTWLKQQKSAAKKSGVELPGVLVTKTSSMCRREGAHYVLHCLTCALEIRGPSTRGRCPAVQDSARNRMSGTCRGYCQLPPRAACCTGAWWPETRDTPCGQDHRTMTIV